jgi:hypothetical protein
MKKKTENPFDFSLKSPKGISSRWETLGLVKKNKVKSGPFVSRLRPMIDAKDEINRQPKTERKPEPEIPVLKGKTGYYFQTRIGGKFGKKIELSESLAQKLMA